MKIDIFCHIAPPKFAESVERLAARGISVTEQEAEPATVLESRFRVMDRYDEYMQVLTLGGFTGVPYGEKGY